MICGISSALEEHRMRTKYNDIAKADVVSLARREAVQQVFAV